MHALTPAQVGPKLPRPAPADEPVVQCPPVGDAHEALCADTGVPVAGMNGDTMAFDRRRP